MSLHKGKFKQPKTLDPAGVYFSRKHWKADLLRKEFIVMLSKTSAGGDIKEQDTSKLEEFIFATKQQSVKEMVEQDLHSAKICQIQPFRISSGFSIRNWLEQTKE